MVGFVELGTDSWITNITGTLLANPTKGLYLFIWTSALMFALRFCAGPIVERISPLGLLLAGACLGTLGLILLSQAGAGFNFGAAWIAAWLAVSVYAMGKTFYWPTMLGVVSERFPRGGALTLGAVGCVGTLSAGLLGGPTIGFMQDYFAAQDLRLKSPAAYDRYRADNANSLLWVFHTTGLDGSKVAVLNDDGKQLQEDLAILKTSGKADQHLARLAAWWEAVRSQATLDRAPVTEATLQGGRLALRWTAVLPALMAVGYVFLIRYFRSKGGYEQMYIESPVSPELSTAEPGPATIGPAPTPGTALPRP
jgi:MFS family permease